VYFILHINMLFVWKSVFSYSAALHVILDALKWCCYGPVDLCNTVAGLSVVDGQIFPYMSMR